MPEFKQYPTVFTMPNRKQRKSQRRSIFAHNQAAYAVARKARRDARRNARKEVIGETE